jgi:hypothetical protein
MGLDRPDPVQEDLLMHAVVVSPNVSRTHPTLPGRSIRNGAVWLDERARGQDDSGRTIVHPPMR